jgi:CBS domain-containing protein
MLVREVMSSDVAAVNPSISVAVAARVMRDRVVGCLPVVEQGQLIGMITDRDLVERVVAEGLDAYRTSVRAAMSAAPISCSADHRAETARQIMEESWIKHLPVLGARGELVGVLAYGDLAGHRPKCRPHAVRFFRKMSSSSGHQHNVEVGMVYLSPATKKEDIPRVAIRRFERDHHVDPWTQLADSYEVVNNH